MKSICLVSSIRIFLTHGVRAMLTHVIHEIQLPVATSGGFFSSHAGSRRELRNRYFPFRVYLASNKNSVVSSYGTSNGEMVLILTTSFERDTEFNVGTLRDSNKGILSRIHPRFTSAPRDTSPGLRVYSEFFLFELAVISFCSFFHAVRFSPLSEKHETRGGNDSIERVKLNGTCKIIFILLLFTH